MRVGSFEVEEGVVYLGAFATLVALLLLWTWFRNSRIADEFRQLARRRGWAWLGSPPAELEEALVYLQDSGSGWKVDRVVAVPRSGPTAYLFYYQRRLSGFESTSKSIDGPACLIPASIDLNAPLFSVQRRPLALLDQYLRVAGDPVDGVGSAQFREKLLVQSSGHVHRGPAEGRALGDVVIPPALADEFLRWHRPLGEIQAWNRVYLRGRTVMVARTGGAEMTEAGWMEVLDMSGRISAALDPYA